MQFSDLKLNVTIQESLRNNGYQNPTPIQAQAIPTILDGQDLLTIVP